MCAPDRQIKNCQMHFYGIITKIKCSQYKALHGIAWAPSLCLSLSFCVSLSVCLSVCLSHSLSLPLCLTLSLSLSLSLSSPSFLLSSSKPFMTYKQITCHITEVYNWGSLGLLNVNMKCRHRAIQVHVNTCTNWSPMLGIYIQAGYKQL